MEAATEAAVVVDLVVHPMDHPVASEVPHLAVEALMTVSFENSIIFFKYPIVFFFTFCLFFRNCFTRVPRPCTLLTSSLSLL